MWSRAKLEPQCLSHGAPASPTHCFINLPLFNYVSQTNTLCHKPDGTKCTSVELMPVNAQSVMAHRTVIKLCW